MRHDKRTIHRVDDGAEHDGVRHNLSNDTARLKACDVELWSGCVVVGAIVTPAITGVTIAPTTTHPLQSSTSHALSLAVSLLRLCPTPSCSVPSSTRWIVLLSWRISSAAYVSGSKPFPIRRAPKTWSRKKLQA